MVPKTCLLLIVAALHLSNALETFQQKVIVNSSELCIIPIKPTEFNWKIRNDSINEIQYSARISQSPDLPEWLKYTYDGKLSIGYVYGVPPKKVNSMNLDVIGWHYSEIENYDVRRLVVSMEIMKKDPLEFIVEMKIDNLNTRHLCDSRRMGRLLNVFKDELGWTMIDGRPVIPSFLASAVEVGENRNPMRPNDAEGVILHLSSDKDFSEGVKKLALEVSKLWKMRPCPKEMKRTSVERHFRGHGFLVDWCSFRLSTVEVWESDDDEEASGTQELGNANDGGEMLPEVSDEDNNSEMRDELKVDTSTKPKSVHGLAETFVFKTEIPERGYGWAALVACVIPGSIGGLVGFLLIALLWVDKEDDMPMCSRGHQDERDWETASAAENVVIVSRPEENMKDIFDKIEEERMPTPLPPQYRETHPNGSPALTYAV